MNAYEAQASTTMAAKGHPDGPRVEITETKKQRVEQTTSNPYLLMTAAGEFFVLLGVITMNVLFRFVESTRDGASMVVYERVTLVAEDIAPIRPYYDYSATIEENQLNSVGTFGIAFSMPEYAFQVPVFVLPLLVIALVESIKHVYSPRQVKVVESVGVKFPMSARRIVRYYYSYLLFGSMAGVFTSLIKLMIPAPRPHFATVCLQAVSANLPTSWNYNHNVSTLCTPVNGDYDLSSGVKEALRSFPSYHAAIAVYSGAFLCLYLHHSVRVRGQYNTSLMFFLPVLTMAGIGALHRYVTYHASYKDVLWGSILGLSMAIYLVYGVLNEFKERSWTILPCSSLISQPQPSSTSPATKATVLAPIPTAQHPQQSPSPLSLGSTNYGYTQPTDFTDNPMPEPRQRTANQQGGGYTQPRPAQPPPAAMLPRVNDPHRQPSRPTQAFNASMVLDDKPAQPVDYNRPRQRYSMPASQQPHMDRGPSRPGTAYDRPQQPRSRYEGTSYF